MHRDVIHVFLVLSLFIVVGLAHSHHNTEKENNWWETLVEFDQSGDIYQFGSGSSINKWEMSGNLASHLQLRPVKRITVPIILNIILSGFSGFGNQKLNLTDEQVSSWFGHIEHQLPHLIVPIGEEQTTTLPYPTTQSHIFYGFHINVIKVSPLYDTILQDQILQNVRETESDTYVDVNHFSAFLHATETSLGLKSMYNIFITNPSSPVEPGQVYGYRAGFSQAELDQLTTYWVNGTRDFSNEIAKILKLLTLPCDEREVPTFPQVLLPLAQQSVSVKTIDYSAVSTQFAEWFIAQKKNSASFNASSDSPDDASFLFDFSRGDEKSIIDLVDEIEEKGSQFDVNYVNKIKAGKGNVPAECVVDVWITKERTMFIDLTAGPFEWGPLIAGEGFRSKHEIPNAPLSVIPLQDIDIHAIDSRFEEQFVHMKELMQVHCTDDIKSATCLDLEMQYTNMKRQYGKVQESYKQVLASSETEEQGSEQWELESFLSQLSATISSGIRQVIVPGAPLFPIEYSPKMVYHLFFIANHQTYDARAIDAFDLQLFKEQVTKLAFPGQEVSFLIKTLPMMESAELSTGFHSSLKSAVLPNLSPEGVFSSQEIHYIDSLTLRDTLKSFRNIQTAQATSLTVVNIPVLIFSLDMPRPILIDKYYQAKALSNMIIAVQNVQRAYPSRLQCNGKTIWFDLRNPLKATLSAVGVLVGGIIPNHITYSEAHQAAVQRWLWSVGDHPTSHCSTTGESFNDFQIDIAHRNAVVESLSDSINTFNEAVRVLHEVHIDDSNRALADILKLNEISVNHGRLLGLWKMTCKKLGILDFAAAIRLALEAEEIADELYLDAIAVTQLVTAYRCLPYTQEEPDTNSQLLLLIPALFICFDILLVVFVFVCRGTTKKVKSKIN